jgi:hypothetical protein
MMRRLAPDQFTFVNMLGPGLRRVEQARNAGDLRAIVNDLFRLDASTAQISSRELKAT